MPMVTSVSPHLNLRLIPQPWLASLRVALMVRLQTWTGGGRRRALADGDVEEIAVTVAAEPVGLVDAGSAVVREHGGVDDGGLSLGAAAVADVHLGVAAHELKVHAPAVAVEAVGVHALNGDLAAGALLADRDGGGRGAGHMMRTLGSSRGSDMATASPSEPKKAMPSYLPELYV